MQLFRRCALVLCTGTAVAILSAPNARASGGQSDPARSARSTIHPAHREGGAPAGARELRSYARNVSRHLLFSLHHARRQGAHERAQCLDAIIARVNATRRTIARYVDALDRAQANGDPRTIRRASDALRVLERRTRRLQARGARCGVRGKPNRTRVEVEVDPSVPTEDPTELAGWR